MTKPALISLTFVAVFLSVQFLGMYVGYSYYQAVQAGILEPALGNPENPANSFYLLGWMLAGTGMVILILRFRRSLLKVLEAFVLFISSWVTFDFLIPISIWHIDTGLVLAVLLTAWKMLRPSVPINILAIIFSLSGVGALLGASLGVPPAMVFILIVSVYDFVSVFLTRHMVFMAKSIASEPTIFAVSVPADFNAKPVRGDSRSAKSRKVRVFSLGSGDIALPLVLIVSLLTNYGLKYAVFSLIGVTAVLFWLLNWRVKGTMDSPRALPAMPFLSIGLMAGFWLSLLV